MSQVGILKGIFAIAGIMVFLWARDDDRAAFRWVGIGLIVAAWLLRFVERGRRGPHADQQRGESSE